MPRIPPARPGMALAEVDTPALILDLDAFEHNLRRLNESLPGRKVMLRPHGYELIHALDEAGAVEQTPGPPRM